jgi:hypothetical protein
VCVLVEIEPPYAVSLVGLDPEAKAAADVWIEQAIVTWGHCLKANVWPGYERRVVYARPSYARMIDAGNNSTVKEPWEE